MELLKILKVYVCLSILLGFFETSDASGWQTVTKPKYQLLFSDSVYDWNNAIKACSNEGASMIKLEDISIRNDVYNTISSNTLYWYGATDEASENIWKWSDGTPVRISIPWKTGEPNGGRRENYLQFEKDGVSDYKSDTYAKTICMKEHVRADNVQISSITTNMTITSTSGRSQISCSAYGIPTPTVYWFRGSTKLAFSTNQRIYQFATSGRSILYLKNNKITLADESQYKCEATNILGGGSRSINIKVSSKPSIVNIISSPCNSSLLIEWKPNIHALGFTHRIQIVDQHNTSYRKVQYIKETKVSMRMIVPELTSSTLYSIKISPCRSQTLKCLREYEVTRFATTGGLPEPVTKPSLHMNDEGLCNVSWSWPMKTDKSFISSFKVLINSTSADIRSYSSNSTKIMNEVNVSFPLMNFTIPKIPNRKYNVSIQAQTCAGFGNENVAVGECVTDSEVPSILLPAAVENQIDENEKLMMEINVPDESNGSVSCFLIVVQIIGNERNMTVLDEDRMNVLKTMSVDNEYIALALRRNRFKTSSKSFVLGDKSNTTCDTTGQQRISDTNNTYYGMNRKLPNRQTYKIYLVASIPSKDKVLFKISEGVIIEEKIKNNDKLTTVFGDEDSWKLPTIIALSCVVFVCIIVATVLLLRTQKNKFMTERLPVVAYHNDAEAIPENEEISNTNIALQDLEEYYTNLSNNEKELCHEQFKKIKIESKANMKSTSFASLPELKRKNRYKNILPYDETRVCIKGNGTGYINACYINGYSRRRKYIATQGPLPTTVDDFWLMIVEQKCRVIVMLAKCFEAGKKKCQKYWPDSKETKAFGRVTVFNAEEVKYCGFIRRRFHIESVDKVLSMEVFQYQYINWPDHSVPNTTSNLVRMHKYVIQCLEETGSDAPMVVHCSAGAGRTGTFIGYDYLLEEGRNTDRVDGLNCVMKMRSQRIDMIQNCDQYVLLHKLILENYLLGDSDFDAQDIGQKFQEIINQNDRRELVAEFETLSRLEPLRCSTTKGRSLKNKKFNLSDDIIPYDHNAVVLMMTGDETDVPYVNASWVESYDEHSPMIASQAPMENGIKLFWRSVLDNKVNTIVMLARTAECVQYWPQMVCDTLYLDGVRVFLMKEEANGGIIRRIMKIFRDNQEQTISHIQYTEWEVDRCPSDGTIVLDIIGEMQKNTSSEQGSAALIHCCDGAGRTGTFCTIVNLVERLKYENKVDVFRAVKDLRDCRRGMVQTLEQYEFCHLAICTFMKSFEIYSNFG